MSLTFGQKIRELRKMKHLGQRAVLSITGAGRFSLKQMGRILTVRMSGDNGQERSVEREMQKRFNPGGS